MAATAYHVIYQTFTSRDHLAEIGKHILVSEYYFQQDEAIARYRQLMKEDSIDNSNKHLPNRSDIESFINRQGFYGRGRDADNDNPEKNWRIVKIAIQ